MTGNEVMALTMATGNFTHEPSGSSPYLPAGLDLAWFMSTPDNERCKDPEPVAQEHSYNLEYNPGCIPLDGCGTPVAFPYFILFTLLVTYVMLNVFVAVILDAFSNEGTEEEAWEYDRSVNDFIPLREPYES